MVVPLRNWTILRPARVALRARRVQKNRPLEAREAKPREGFFSQFSAMLEHQADLMIRDNTLK